MVDLLRTLGMPTTGRKPGHVVGWRQGRPVRYNEFLSRARAWRELLRRMSGQTFALHLNDSLEFASALLGAWSASKVIYLPGDTLPATCVRLRQSVDGYLGEFESRWNPRTPAPEDEKSHGDDFEGLKGDFIGLVLFTSGSTGVPDAIPKKLSQMFQEVLTLEALFGGLLGAAEIITTVSHQHIYGLLFNVLWPLAAGRAIQARSLSLPRELAEVRAQHEAVLISSPAYLKRLPEYILRTTTNRFRAVFSSGGPLSFAVADEVKRLLGFVPIEVFGSSETGGVAWRQQHDRMSGAWTPMPGVTWRVCSDERVLEVRSPHLPDENWFRTADRAVAVGERHFLVTGRVDRIVKIEGKRVSLSAIELGLTTSPMVADARVIVMEGRRTQVAAFILPSMIGRNQLAKVGQLVFNRMLRNTLTPSIEPIGIPRIWRYLDAWPTNAQGKTTHAELIGLLDREQSRATLPRQRLVERKAHRAVLELSAPRDLCYFNGHFPGMPVLAGVVQIHWAITYGRQYFALPPIFRGIHGLKLQRIIGPEEPFTLELIYEPTKSSLFFKITSPVGRHSCGRAIFGAADV